MISVRKEMMGWQWHQLDRIEIIYTLLHTYNHVTQILQVGCSSQCPTNSVKALKAVEY